MSETVQEYDRFICLSCPERPVIEARDFFKHLTEVHGIKEGARGTREMMCHMDGRDFFIWKHRRRCACRRADRRPFMHDGLIVDLFAGGGGASLGIRMATGRDPDVAVNHDPKAVGMHRANHPDTRHYCQDVWEVLPRQATRGRPVSLLWASPDCTHHSRAKGGPPKRDEKKRDLAWVIEKWAREVRPRIIILENVEEFADWGPLDQDRKIIKSQRGTYFAAFRNSLLKLGYRMQWRPLVACDYGAPTSRKRLFLIARCDGAPIVWPEATHGDPAGVGVISGRLLPWRTAAEIIDWSIPARSIFNRERPLAEATLRRIAKGIDKFVIHNASPFIVPIAHYDGSERVHSLDEPLRTITAAPRGGSFALVTAFMAQHNGGATGHGGTVPLSTITGRGTQQQLVALHLIRHFSSSIGQAITAPIPTIMAKTEKTGIVAGYLVKFKGTSKHGQSLTTPLHTVQTGQHYALCAAFMQKYYGCGCGQGLQQPLHTITGKDRMGLVIIPIHGEEFILADILMRMLTPRELFLAQGFPPSYIIDVLADGRAITKSDQVHLCGNSVSPPNAAALLRANLTQVGRVYQDGCGAPTQMNLFAAMHPGERANERRLQHGGG